MDSELSKNDKNASSSMKVSSTRVMQQNNRNIKLNDLVSGRISVNRGAGPLRNLGKRPSISTSVDLKGVGRLGRRFETLQTPGNQLRSNVDTNHNHLEQILSKHEQSVSKSLAIDDGSSIHSRYNTILPRTTRNKPYEASRDIAQANIRVIPPPTSIG